MEEGKQGHNRYFVFWRITCTALKRAGEEGATVPIIGFVCEDIDIDTKIHQGQKFR